MSLSDGNGDKEIGKRKRYFPKAKESINGQEKSEKNRQVWRTCYVISILLDISESFAVLQKDAENTINKACEQRWSYAEGCWGYNRQIMWATRKFARRMLRIQ